MSSKLNAWCLIVCLTLASAISAAEPPPMEVRVYSIDFGSPPARVSLDPREVLIKEGIPFPEGAVAVFNPRGSRLTVKNTKENLTLLDEFVRVRTPSRLNDADLIVTFVEGPAGKLDELGGIQNEASHRSEKLQRLVRAAAEKMDGLRISRIAFVSARSGQQCTVESGVDHSFTDKVELDKKGHASVDTQFRISGLSVEMEPTIGFDHETVDVNIAVSLSLTPPERRQERVSAPISRGVLERPVTAFPGSTLRTSVTLKKGESRLLSVWNATPAEDEKAVAVILTSKYSITPPDFILPNSLAATLPNEQDKAQTRTFRVPLDFAPTGFSFPETGEKGPFRDPAVEFPKGTTVKLEAAGKLMVKSTARFLDEVDAWAEVLWARMRKTVVLDACIVEVPAKLAHSVIAESAGKSDHTPAFQKVMAAAGRGEARVVDACHLDANTESGQRCRAESILMRQSIDKLSWDSDDHVTATTQQRDAGFKLEASPILYADESSVEIDLTLEHHFAPFATQREAFTDPATKRRFEIPRDDFSIGRIRTSITMKPATTRIIGALSAGEYSTQRKDEIVHLAFLSCHVVRHEPGPVPMTETRPDDRVPGKFMDDMIARVIPVPPDFLSLGAPAVAKDNPTDPFATGAAMPALKARPNAKEILEAQGIPFPPGASVVFDRVTAQLFITNTRANFQLIEAFLTELCQKPKGIVTTVHLFEGDGSLLRKLAWESAGKADHREQLDLLRDQVKSSKVKSLGIARITTKSGQPASDEEEKNVSYFSGTSINDNGLPSISRSEMPVGLTVEIEPTIEGQAVNVNCTMDYHTAPPAAHSERVAMAVSNKRKVLPAIELPLMDFHRMHSTTPTVIISGRARILSLWRPRGKPDAEKNDIMQIAILEAAID